MMKLVIDQDTIQLNVDKQIVHNDTNLMATLISVCPDLYKNIQESSVNLPLLYKTIVNNHGLLLNVIGCDNYDLIRQIFKYSINYAKILLEISIRNHHMKLCEVILSETNNIPTEHINKCFKLAINGKLPIYIIGLFIEHGANELLEYVDYKSITSLYLDSLVQRNFPMTIKIIANIITSIDPTHLEDIDKLIEYTKINKLWVCKIIYEIYQKSDINNLVYVEYILSVYNKLNYLVNINNIFELILNKDLYKSFEICMMNGVFNNYNYILTRLVKQDKKFIDIFVDYTSEVYKISISEYDNKSRILLTYYYELVIDKMSMQQNQSRIKSCQQKIE